MKKGLVFFSFVLASWFLGFVFFGQHINNYKIDTQNKTDAIVVLTGGKNRIKTAIDLAATKLGDKIFISGVSKKVSMKDLEKRNDIMIKENLNITIGKVATNTIGNAIESKDWIERNQIQSIRLVTSNYHLPRSMLEFRKQTPKIEIIAHPVWSENINPKWWTSYATFALVFAEYNKFLYVYVRNLL